MLYVTRKRVPIVHAMKDLGVSVTSDLSWNSHVNTLVSECNRMMGMIKSCVIFSFIYVNNF